MNSGKNAFILFLLLFPLAAIFSQEVPDSSRSSYINVFIDCNYCYEDFIKTEITFVNYTRDRLQADVHILISSQSTGGGGREYTLTLFGQNRFSGQTDTLRFFTANSSTEEETRKALVKYLKLGLIRYAAVTAAASSLDISFNKQENKAIVDPWNSWVFSASINSYMNGESSRKYASFYGSLSARRTTEDEKLGFSINGSYNEDKFDFDDGSVLSLSRSQRAEAYYVKGLGERWSVGCQGIISASTYSNINTSYNLSAGIEYNIFPYKESTHHLLRISYLVYGNRVNYSEETIYNKLHENLFRHSLSLNLDLKQPWGSIYASLEGSSYFHDMAKNHLQFYTEFSFRIFEGFSVRLYGQAEMVHDQLSLRKGEATPDEIFLQRRQLATQYSYYTSFGITYSFGSIYNNIVNSRFGN